MSVQEVMSEIETLRNLKNDAILDLKEYYVVEEENHVYVITEILYGGAVLDAILKMKDERYTCLLYTSPSPRDGLLSRMPSSA